MEVRAVDVNHSLWDCSMEGGAIRLGLRMIVGMRQADGVIIEQVQPFRSMEEFQT